MHGFPLWGNTRKGRLEKLTLRRKKSEVRIQEAEEHQQMHRRVRERLFF
jgi:hypothetical protein